MNEKSKPGRKSAASMSVVAPFDSEPSRPPAPEDLTPEQAEVWRGVVDAMPADWFPAPTHPLLAAYCRHTVASRHIDGLIRECHAGDPDLALLNRLSIMLARETGATIALGRAMRLNQQAQMHPRSAGRKVHAMPPAPPPWTTPPHLEDEGENDGN